jgi:O-antigen ligase
MISSGATSIQYYFYFFVFLLAAVLIPLNYPQFFRQPDYAFTLCVTAIFLFILAKSFRVAVIFGIIYFLVKAFLWRILFYLNYSFNGTILETNIFLTTGGFFLAILFGVYLFKRIFITKSKIIEFPLDRYILIYMGFCTLQIFNPGVTLLQGLAGFEKQVVPTMAMYFLARDVFRDKTDLQRFFRIFVIYVIIALSYGLYQQLFGLPEIDNTWFSLQGIHEAQNWFLYGPKGPELRVFSLSGTEFDFLFPIIALVALKAGLLLQCKEFKQEKLTFLLFALLLTFFIFAIPRTAIAGVLIGVVSALTFAGSSKKLVRNIVILAVIVSFTFMPIRNLASTLKLTGIQKHVRLAELVNPLQAETMQRRREDQWRQAVNVGLRNLFGVGLGSGSYSRVTVGERNVFFLGAHSEYLTRLVELGFPGLLLFILLLFSIFMEMIYRFKNSQDPFYQGLIKGIFGVLIAYSAIGIADIPLSHGASSIFFWFLVGILPVIPRIEDQLPVASS